MPVGTVLKPAASARRITSSGSAVVAISTSPCGTPSSVLRPAPPTTRASSPSRLSAASRPLSGASLSQAASIFTGGSLGRPRHELAVLDMRRDVLRAGGLAAPLRQHDEAAEHQHERRDGE